MLTCIVHSLRPFLSIYQRMDLGMAPSRKEMPCIIEQPARGDDFHLNGSTSFPTARIGMIVHDALRVTPWPTTDWRRDFHNDNAETELEKLQPDALFSDVPYWKWMQ